MGRGVVFALVLESRVWSPLCLRSKWCWRLCLGRGRRRARVGTCVEVLVAVVIVLELVLVPAFRSWSPGGWKAGEGCSCDQGMDSGVVSVVDSVVDSGSILAGILGDLAF